MLFDLKTDHSPFNFVIAALRCTTTCLETLLCDFSSTSLDLDNQAACHHTPLTLTTVFLV